MATSISAGVSLADVYGLLLDDIRRNRATRLATHGADKGTPQTSDDDTRADEPQRVGVNDGQ